MFPLFKQEGTPEMCEGKEAWSFLLSSTRSIIGAEFGWNVVLPLPATPSA